MNLSKRGYIFLFVGIILLVLSFFVTVNWSFIAWLALFFLSLAFCTTGIIMLIVHLMKQIKEENRKY